MRNLFVVFLYLDGYMNMVKEYRKMKLSLKDGIKKFAAQGFFK